MYFATPASPAPANLLGLFACSPYLHVLLALHFMLQEPSHPFVRLMFGFPCDSQELSQLSLENSVSHELSPLGNLSGHLDLLLLYVDW